MEESKALTMEEVVRKLEQLEEEVKAGTLRIKKLEKKVKHLKRNAEVESIVDGRDSYAVLATVKMHRL